MSGVNGALVWELWRLSRLELLARVAFSFSLILLFYGAQLLGKDYVAPEMRITVDATSKQLFAGLAIVTLFNSSIFSSAWLKLDSHQVGFDFQLGFARPIATERLVLIPLLFLVVSAVFSFLAPVLLFRWIFGISMALWVPVVLLVSVTTSLVCAAWSASSRMGRTLALLAVATAYLVAGGLWCAQRESQEPLLLAMGRADFYRLSWYHFCVLVLVTSAAVAICVRSVRCQRHGDRHWLGWKLADRIPQPPTAETVVVPSATSQWIHGPAVSPWRAQVWRLWRQAGMRVLGIAFLLPLLLTTLVTCIQLFDVHWRGGPYLWLAALIGCPVVYQILACEWLQGLQTKGQVTQLSVFDAVQPTRGDRLIVVKLVVISVLSATGWLLMAAFAGLQTWLAGDWSFWQELGGGVARRLTQVAWYYQVWGVAALLGIFWIGSAAILAFGLLSSRAKARHIVIVEVVILTLVAVAILDGKRDWQFDWFWDTVQILGVLFAVGVGIGCLWQAIRRRAFAMPYGVAAILCWGITLSGVIRMSVLVAPLLPVLAPSDLLLGGCGMAAAMLTSVLLPPLAYNRLRHG